MTLTTVHVYSLSPLYLTKYCSTNEGPGGYLCYAKYYQTRVNAKARLSAKVEWKF